MSVITTAAFSSVPTICAIATGASLTGASVTVTVPVAVSAPSDAVYWKLAAPAKSGSGVNVIAPPASATVPCWAPPTAVTITTWPSASTSLAASALAATVNGVSSSPPSASATAIGASGTGVTVTATAAVSVSAPSDTVDWKLAGPL